MALDRSLSRRRLLQLAGGATLSAAAAGTLAACGGGSGSGSSSGGTLKLIGVGDQEAGLRKVLDSYKAAHSGFDFNLSFAPADQVQTALRTQLGGGNAPDVHVVYPGNGSAMSMAQLSKAGLLTDLSGQSWTQKIPAGFKGAFQSAGQASFADSGWVDAMNKYLELQKKGFFNDNPNGTTYEQATSMVATGKAAMAVQVSAVLSAFRAASPSPDDLSMFPFPATDVA